LRPYSNLAVEALFSTFLAAFGIVMSQIFVRLAIYFMNGSMSFGGQAISFAVTAYCGPPRVYHVVSGSWRDLVPLEGRHSIEPPTFASQTRRSP
jgi:hypothetical protein